MTPEAHPKRVQQNLRTDAVAWVRRAVLGDPEPER